MSLSHHLLRQPLPPKPAVLQHLCTTSALMTSTTNKSTSTNRHHHDFLPPTTYIASWKPSNNPKDVAARLAFLRHDYDKKVRELRKTYVQEMELQRIDKLCKDEARKEALRIANEERKAAKAARKKAEAIARQAAEEEFRQMLMKERAAKLEYWRMREKQVEEKKKEKNELIRRQSSLWVEESKLEAKSLEEVVSGRNRL